MAPITPSPDDIMAFRYPDESFHRFYNDFPAGRRVKAFEAYVDLTRTIIVLDTRIAEMDRDGVEYTAVQFQSHNGTLLWTTFCKDDEELLEYFLISTDT